MKNILLTTLLLLSFNTLINAQTNVYYPFPDSGAQWNQNNGNYSFNGYYYYTDFGYAYKQTHDTIINSVKYHLINWGYRWATDSVYASNDFTDSNFHNSTFDSLAFGIREDSLHRIFVKVFSYNIPGCYGLPLVDTDYLLYNFNIKPGDTLSNNYPFYNGATVIISGYDSVLVGNSYRKAIKLAITNSQVFPDSDEWVEGIGSINFGLLGPFTPSFQYILNGTHCTNIFDCFSINNQTLLTSHYGCDSPTGINQISPQILHLQIFPNPTSDLLYLKFSQTFIPKEITIYNTLGQQIYLSSNAAINNSIDVKNLPAGLYFIKATNNVIILTGSFVKE